MVSNPDKDRILNQEAITCAKSLKGLETPVALAVTTTTSTAQAVTAAVDDGRRQLSVDLEISGKFQNEKLKTGVKHRVSRPAFSRLVSRSETRACAHGPRSRGQQTGRQQRPEAREEQTQKGGWCVSHRREGEEQRAAKLGGKGDVAGQRQRASVPQKQQPSLRWGTWGHSARRGGLAEPGDSDGTRGARVSASLTKQLWAVFRDCVAAAA